MTHVMIDIETLGTKPGCAILAIAAIPFGAIAEGEPFYEKIDPLNCSKLGLAADQSTLDWWDKQDKRARAEAFSGVRHLPDVLEEFSQYIKQYNSVRVWGNGASFDVPILEAAFTRCGIPVPWKYYNSFCYRTLKNLYPQVPYYKPLQAHHALEDAKAQAAHAERIFKLYNIGDM